MHANKLGVIKFEAAETAAVKTDKDGDDFRIAKSGFTVSSFDVGSFAKQQLLDGFFKFEAEIIYAYKDLRNFVSGGWNSHLI